MTLRAPTARVAAATLFCIFGGLAGPVTKAKAQPLPQAAERPAAPAGTPRRAAPAPTSGPVQVVAQQGEVLLSKSNGPGRGAGPAEPLLLSSGLSLHDEISTRQGTVELLSSAGIGMRLGEGSLMVLLSPNAVYLARGELLITTRPGPGQSPPALSVATPSGRTPVKARSARVSVDGDTTTIAVYVGAAFLGGYPPFGAVVVSGQSSRWIKGERPTPAGPAGEPPGDFASHAPSAPASAFDAPVEALPKTAPATPKTAPATAEMSVSQVPAEMKPRMAAEAPPAPAAAETPVPAVPQVPAETANKSIEEPSARTEGAEAPPVLAPAATESPMAASATAAAAEKRSALDAASLSSADSGPEDILMGGVGEVPLDGIRSPWAGSYVGVRLESTVSGSLRLWAGGRFAMRNGFGVDASLGLLRAALTEPPPGESVAGIGNITLGVRTPALRRRYLALQGVALLTAPLSTSFLDTSIEVDQPYIGPDDGGYGLRPSARPRGGGWRIEPALLFGVRGRILTLFTQQGASFRVAPDLGAAYTGGLTLQAEVISALRFITFLAWQVNYLGFAPSEGGAAPDVGGALGGGIEALLSGGRRGRVRLALLGRVGLGEGGAAIYGRGALSLQLGYAFR